MKCGLSLSFQTFEHGAIRSLKRGPGQKLSRNSTGHSASFATNSLQILWDAFCVQAVIL